MSAWGRKLKSAMEGNQESPEAKAAPITLEQFRNIPYHYLRWIRILRIKDGKPIIVDKAYKKLLYSDPDMWSMEITRGEWHNMLMDITIVNDSLPTDSYSDMIKALHVSEVVGQGIPLVRETLPWHLKYLSSITNPETQLCNIRHTPDFYPEIQLAGVARTEKWVPGASNKIVLIMFEEANLLTDVLVESSLTLEAGQIAHVVQTTPCSDETKEYFFGGMRTTWIGDYAQNSSVPLKILLWNVRGIENINFIKNLHVLLKEHKPSMVILTETRVRKDKATKIKDSLPFDDGIVVDSIGLTGGILMLWKNNEIEVTYIKTTDQSIHVTVLGADDDPRGC